MWLNKNYLILNFLTVYFFLIGNLSAASSLSDTIPNFGFDIEFGLTLARLDHFTSNIYPFSEEIEIEKTEISSSSFPSGYFFSFGGIYFFNKHFGIEFDFSLHINELAYQYKIEHATQDLLWSEQKWNVNVGESLIHVPIVGILAFGRKKQFSLGVGGYTKISNGTNISTEAEIIEYIDGIMILNEPKISSNTTKFTANHSYHLGWMLQVATEIPFNNNNSIFFKCFYQKDLKPLSEEPFIKIQRLGVNFGYRCMFERT